MYLPLMQNFCSLGFHLGQLHDKWKPAVLMYILGFRFKLTMQSLDKSVLLFRLALKFAQKISKLKLPVFLFCLRKWDLMLKFFYVSMMTSFVFSFGHIIPGMLTNFKVVSQSYEQLQKKNLLFPSLVVNTVVNPSIGFVREAQYLGVPLIAIVDSSVVYLEEIAYPILATTFLQDNFFLDLFRYLFGLRSFSFVKKNIYLAENYRQLIFNFLRGSIKQQKLQKLI